MLNRKTILLVGAGGHARACIDVVEQEGRHTILGLVGLLEEVGGSVLGYPVLGTEGDFAGRIEDYPNAIITAGQIRKPDLRMGLFEMFRQAGHTLPAIVSPHAYVSKHATVGEGSIVMHGAIVNAGAAVGRNCIINSHALVEHDAWVGDHCHLSTGAVLNGGVRVGAGTFVGSNTTVRQSAVIGARCFIGMGERVLSDLADEGRLPAPKGE